MKRSILAMFGIAATTALGMAAGTADADPVADRSRVVGTEDGWELTISKTAEDVQRVPNLAATPFTREGFVSLSATAEIGGEGRAAVNSGTMQLGYQIGCQADVSNGVTAGLSAAIGPNATVTVVPSPGLAVGASALALPNISATIKPGTVSTITLGTKPLAGPHASISVDQVQIKIDACAGAVSLRSFAMVSISTDTADNSVAAYGDPIWL
ncbi:MspA family porin [Nocardia wallacei]|uniref:MspA family porin n=1 Tax=Nocardia TaxID=1817 RepID=UPI002458B4A2|nr:MspA family porin [Nocardia wallacei]